VRHHPIILQIENIMVCFIAVIRVSVRENVAIGEAIMTLSAYDPDGSSDGEVTYEYEGNGTVR